MKPYNKENTTKGEEVREMFDNIAPAYDNLNHTLSFHIDKLWRRRVVRYVKRQSPTNILDMATGTGDLAIAMARAIPQAHVTGVDLSKGMLEVAQQKIEQLALSERISLEQGAAETLRVESGTMDVVTAAFGVRNFENLELGLSEMARTLRSGGHLVVLEFSTPTNWLFAPLYKFYSRHILPRIGALLSKDRSAYEYLPSSVEEFLTPKEFVALMQKLGLENCSARSLSCGIAQIYTAQKR